MVDAAVLQFPSDLSVGQLSATIPPSYGCCYGTILSEVCARAMVLNDFPTSLAFLGVGVPGGGGLAARGRKIPPATPTGRVVDPAELRDPHSTAIATASRIHRAAHRPTLGRAGQRAPAGSGRTDPTGLGRVEVDALHPAEAGHCAHRTEGSPCIGHSSHHRRARQSR
jgi:hypothetical protein